MSVWNRVSSLFRKALHDAKSLILLHKACMQTSNRRYVATRMHSNSYISVYFYILLDCNLIQLLRLFADGALDRGWMHVTPYKSRDWFAFCTLTWPALPLHGKEQQTRTAMPGRRYFIIYFRTYNANLISACSLQACLNKNTYSPDKCEVHMRKLYECCRQMYRNTKGEGESTACPNERVVERWLKNHGDPGPWTGCVDALVDMSRSVDMLVSVKFALFRYANKYGPQLHRSNEKNVHFLRWQQHWRLKSGRKAHVTHLWHKFKAA